MYGHLLVRPWIVAFVIAGFALCAGPLDQAWGQGDLIGKRGGQVAPTPTTPPVLPSTLNLPSGATSSLVNGLNSSGTAVRHGMGWLVSDLTHQGIHGQQLSDVIHQLKPYKQRGVLTFPQNTQTPAFQQPAFPFQQPGSGQGAPNFGKGKGKGKGKG